MTLPYSFSSGQKAKAAEVNANFTYLLNKENTDTQGLTSSITEVRNTANTASSKLSRISPVGEVIWFASSSVPTGYLRCNGAAVSRTDYSDLFSAIGTTFGSGDGSTTFNLPTLTDNRFIEGHTSVGSYKSAGLPNITGAIGTPSNWLGGHNGCIYTISSGRYVDSDGNAQYADYVGINASRSSSVYGNSSTVQPKSLTLLPCIKY